MTSLFPITVGNVCIQPIYQYHSLITAALIQSIKIGKSDLIVINCVDQSVEIDDTLVSFIELS